MITLIGERKPQRIVRLTLITFVALTLVWTLAWMLKVHLDTQVVWLTTSFGGFVFWTIAKILIWILPALWLIHLSGRSLGQVFNVSNWKKWLAWGGIVGFLIALTGFIPHYLAGVPLLPTKFSFALLNVLLIAPVFEEFLMRGAIFGNLLKGFSLLKANLLSSLMFVCLHMPGWFFMGSLMENLSKPVGGALSIFTLSLAFGYVTYRGRSVFGGMLTHALNNLA